MTSDAAAPPEEQKDPPAEVRPALGKFERGDFRGATADIDTLLAAQPAPDVAAAARALAGRMAPDPWALRFGLLALTLLAIVVAVFAH